MKLPRIATSPRPSGAAPSFRPSRIGVPSPATLAAATSGCGCGSARRGIAPANCNDIQRQTLQAEVDSYCHGQASSCANLTDCDQLIENADTFSRCVEARRNINNICFDGGDDGHREAARRAGVAQYTCLNRFLARCQNHQEYGIVRDFLALHPNP